MEEDSQGAAQGRFAGRGTVPAGGRPQLPATRRCVAFLLLLLLPGCYYFGQNTAADITPKPSSGWSGPELLTVIMEAGNHNLLDGRTNIKAIATPYYPSVVKAIGRRAQQKLRWSEEEFRAWVDRLAHEGSAMFIDWDKADEPVFDARLDSLRSATQFDSLMMLLTLRNIAWPCGKYVIFTMYGRPLSIPLDRPDCEAPDITRLEGNILLVNDRGEFIVPMNLWGRRMNYLTNADETLFVKFLLRSGDHHFLEGSRRFFLVVKGLESDIRLEFSTAAMR